MKNIEAYCDICYETHEKECQKIADVLMPIIQRQIDNYYITGEPPKAISMKKEKFTAFNMAYIAMIMIVEGAY